jgi:NACHT domain
MTGLLSSIWAQIVDLATVLASGVWRWIHEHWVEIIVGAAALAVYDIAKHIMRPPKRPRHASARGAARLLRRYFSTELALLRTWPSLISASTIDFSSDYVSLVLVEQACKDPIRPKRSMTVDDILRSQAPVAVVSGPGCGKTTLLLRMQYELLSRHRFSFRLRPRSVPIFMRAKDIIARENPIRTAMVERLSRDMASDDARQLVEVGLECGWFSVLIDGLDEIDNEIISFLQEIQLFIQRYSSTHVIVSSRPISYDLSVLMAPGPHAFNEVAIAPLSLEKKRALIDKYAPDSRTAKKIIDLIIEHPFLSELTSVTINVILLIESVTYADEIRYRAEFYKHASQVLLSSVPERKGYRLAYSTPAKVDLLAKASFNALVGGLNLTRQAISEHAQLPNVPSELVFAEILQTSGLLRLVALDRYDFPHRTFIEYFAAIAVSKDFDALPEAVWTKLLSGRLNEVIAFVSNIRPNIDSIIDKVLLSDSDRAMVLAICLSECRSVTQDRQRAAEAVIWDYLRSTRDLLVQQSLARRILSRIHAFPRSPGIVTIYDRLIDQLASPERSVPGEFPTIEDAQANALKYLIHTRGTQIVPRLAAILTDSGAEGWARFKAGELLAILSREDLVGDLELAYQTNWDDDVRRFVVEGLVRTRSMTAIRPLENACSDADRTIRDLAWEGIAYIRERRFLEDATLVRVSDTESSQKSILPGCDLSAVEALDVATDRLSPYRLDAFFKLREDCPPGAGERLAKVATNADENEFFRAEAVKLIGSQADIGFAALLSNVFASFDSDNPAQGVGARGYAIEYLAYRKHRATLQCIVDNNLKLRDANERTKVFWSINEILSDMTAEELVPFRSAVVKLCADNVSEPYERLHHWRKKIEYQLSTRLTAIETTNCPDNSCVTGSTARVA